MDGERSIVPRCYQPTVDWVNAEVQLCFLTEIEKQEEFSELEYEVNIL